MNQNDLLCLHQTLGYDERADDIISDNPTCISNDVGIAMGKAEHLEDIHTAVHAGNNCEVSPRRKGKSCITKVGHKLGVVGHQFVGVRGEVGG